MTSRYEKFLHTQWSSKLWRGIGRVGTFSLPIFAFLFCWEIISRSGIVNKVLFPAPTAVGVSLWAMLRSGTLIADLESSLWRLVIGLSMGVIVGVGVGIATARNRVLSRLLLPAIQFVRPLPPVAIIPLVIVWFGIDDAAKIFSIAFAVFFPVWINTHIGAERIPQIYLWGAKLLRFSYLQRLFCVLLPSALPHIIAGVRNGIAIAFVMIFVSELAGASSGVGYRISVSHLAYRIDEMMAALVVLGVLGAAADYLFMTTARERFPWLRIGTR